MYDAVMRFAFTLWCLGPLACDGSDVPSEPAPVADPAAVEDGDQAGASASSLAEAPPKGASEPVDAPVEPEAALTPEPVMPSECEKACLDSRRAEAVAWEEIERSCKAQCAAKMDAVAGPGAEGAGGG
jgi:hypothetical protein